MKRTLAYCLVLACLAGSFEGQTLESRPPQGVPTPGSPSGHIDATYAKLRNVHLGQEAIRVNNFTLRRDAGTFLFKSGVFYLLEPVNGKITGAAFLGEGEFTLTPPVEVERRNLSILTRGQPFDERFTSALFRFTDGSEDELRKAGTADNAPANGDAAALLADVQMQLRKKIRDNLSARLLQDVLSSQPGGKFTAFIKGKNYSDKMVYDVDPHGSSAVKPEEVSLMIWDENAAFIRGKNLSDKIVLNADPHGPSAVRPEEVSLLLWDENHAGIWAGFHFSKEYAAGTANSDEQNGDISIEHQKLDTSIAKNAFLSGTAETSFTALRDGVRVVPFDLFPTLRVASVTGQNGEPLSFIQEDKDEDADFAVILPRELKKGESYTVTTKYGGKDAVKGEGGGNYYPIARENWYPGLGFGSYSTYDMTFRIPKGMTMVGTGTPGKNIDEGNENISQWSATVPQAVAGFNFGRFKRDEGKPLKQPYVLETYANPEPPDVVKQLLTTPVITGNITMGTLSTVGLMKKAMGEAQLAIEIYTDYFGEAPYKRLAMTQQTAFDYGQSWPGLVYLPITYFFDTTQRHQIGFEEAHGYFKMVGPHEIAHQWWGHLVGFNSYRDQWMSEGFADMSASLFLQMVYGQKNLDEYHSFWADERQLLIQRNAEGRRPIDVGPVTMGYRLDNAKTGDIGRALLYPKGAYILQMVRFMMQNTRAKDPDGEFKAMLHEFTKTYANRIASTEDFKAVLEKHMNADMDLGGNHKMDWFFNQYVYGTDYPTYKFTHSFSTDANGEQVLNFTLAQTNVGPDFVMTVPVYLDFGERRFLRLGSAKMKGSQTIEQHIPLKGLKDKPKRAMVAYFDDLMADVENK